MLRKRLVRPRTLGLLCLLMGVAGVACSSGTGVHIRPCTAADAVITLAVNQYVSIDPATDFGCAVFPATTALAAEYLIVPQLVAGVPGQTAAFRVGGDTILPAPPPSALLAESAVELGPAERFHRFLRLGDEQRSWGLAPELVGPRSPPPSCRPLPPAL